MRCCTPTSAAPADIETPLWLPRQTRVTAVPNETYLTTSIYNLSLKVEIEDIRHEDKLTSKDDSDKNTYLILLQLI